MVMRILDAHEMLTKEEEAILEDDVEVANSGVLDEAYLNTIGMEQLNNCSPTMV